MCKLIKVCVIDEYDNIMYFKCNTAQEILDYIYNLDFIVNVVEYKHYMFKDKIKECDFVLEEFIY